MSQSPRIAAAIAPASTDTPPAHALEALVQRVRTEYDEMPGLALTLRQVQRLCGLDGGVCEAVMAALVERGYLRVTPRGFARA